MAEPTPVPEEAGKAAANAIVREHGAREGLPISKAMPRPKVKPRPLDIYVHPRLIELGLVK